MKEKKNEKQKKNPYQTNKGGKIEAPYIENGNEPKPIVEKGKTDLRTKR